MKTCFVSRRDAVADKQWQRIKQLRTGIEARPIATHCGTFQFDLSSRLRLQSVVEAFGPGWEQWFDVDNNPVELSPSALRELYYDLVGRSGKRVLELGVFTRELRARLPLAEDDPVLRGEGWPG